MNYKSKANRIGIYSLALLALRIIETVIKSAITEARESKLFLQVEEVSGRFQAAIEPGNRKQQKEAVDAKFLERRNLFDEIYTYLQGLLNSPDAEMKNAATLLFNQMNKYGRSYTQLKIADQSLRYIRIIESLKKDEFKDAFTKTLLTAKFAALDQLQLDYEELYMGLGNTKAISTAPSNLRKEMENALKVYVDELHWMAGSYDTEAWNALYKNVCQRFDEVNVSATRKKTDNSTDSTNSTKPENSADSTNSTTAA